jgi:hypothetical protein
MKLSTHGSNLNSIFVIINELEIFLVMEVFIQESNIMELVTFLEKIEKLYIQTIAATLKMASWRTMGQSKSSKK